MSFGLRRVAYERSSVQRRPSKSRPRPGRRRPPDRRGVAARAHRHDTGARRRRGGGEPRSRQVRHL